MASGPSSVDHSQVWGLEGVALGRRACEKLQPLSGLVIGVDFGVGGKSRVFRGLGLGFTVLGLGFTVFYLYIHVYA